MFQIYVNPDREIVKEQVGIEKAGYKALCITVDSAVPGKRERDLRNKIQLKLKKIQQQKAAAKGTSSQLPLISRKLLTFSLEHTGTRARKAGSYANRDPALCWDDIDWFMSITKLPIVLKGVATAEDAAFAAKKVWQQLFCPIMEVEISTSRSGIEILPEVMKALRSEVFTRKWKFGSMVV